jgi:tetratricopeptide (TPR) repeat protein
MNLTFQKKAMSFAMLGIGLAFLLFAGMSCDSTGDKKLYSVERLHFAAEKLHDKRLGIKPELATESDYRQVIDEYMKVVTTFELNFSDVKDKDSITVNEGRAAFLAGSSLLEAARLNLLSSDTIAAVKLLGEFDSRFPHNRDHGAMALLQLGRIEEQLGHAESAELSYMRLLESYYPPADRSLRPNTDVLELPVKMARMYEELEDTRKTKEMLDRAETYYKGIIEKFKFSPLGMTTTRFLADTYIMRDKPNEAIGLLETVIDSTGTIIGSAQILIAGIYASDKADTSEAKRRYQTVIQSSENDTALLGRAYMQLAGIEFASGNYDECRKLISTVKEKFKKFPAVQAKAQQIFAASFEQEDDFNRAYSEYQWLLTNYPDSREAIDTYRRLPGFLRTHGQATLADEWFQKAQTFLTAKRESSKGNQLGLASQAALVNLYVDAERWDETVSEMERLQTEYPRSVAGSQALARAGNVLRDKLGDRTKAKLYYERQLSLYPDVPISEEVKRHLNP